ncbi:MAG TPA: DNRLRE domain-containing protein [Gaiellaceae bacterium]|nr:DNRLRE domain-containing protein [Gaiellaceae bacterium]
MRRFRLTPLRLAAAVVLGVVASMSIAYAASLGVGTKQLHAWNQTLTKAACNQTYSTADDTFVQKSKPTTTSGAATTLSIAGGANPDYGFIRFDLSACNLPTTAGADSASLTLFVTSQQGHTISLYPVYTSWSGSTLTWNGVSSLTIGTTATTSFTPTKNQAYTVPVTADVDAAIKAGTLWGWELVDTTSGPAKTTQIASAENATTANRPSLTLSYEK